MTNALYEFKAGLREAAGLAAPDGMHCVKCRDPFSAANIFTPAGEREARISGFCERCWDEIFKEKEDE